MRRFCLAVFLAAFAFATTHAIAPARAEFPEKAITIQLPFGPGGGTDMLTRAFGTHAKEVFGDNFVITYKPGGGSAVGTTALARENNDGYTIGMGSLPHMYLQPAAGSGQYSLDDFDYIGLIASEPQMMVTPKGSPHTSYEALKAASQADPGTMTLGVSSPLSESWLAYSIVNDIEELGFTVVTYQGGAALNAALMGNQVDAAMTNIGPVFGLAERLNFLALTGEDRFAFVPDVPTFRELGVDVTTSVERVFMAPAGVPEGRLEVLRQGFKEIWHKAEFQQQAAEMRFGLKWIDGAQVRDHLEASKPAVLEIYEKTQN